MENEIIKIGIGVMILKDGEMLLGRRKGNLAPDVYAWPGGHLEYMESFEDCAKRETMEETGMEMQNVRFLGLRNLKDYAPKHFVNIGVVADWKSGEPQLLEPEKCEGWDWYDLNNLPEPLFPTIRDFLESYKGGQNFFDN